MKTLNPKLQNLLIFCVLTILLILLMGNFFEIKISRIYNKNDIDLISIPPEESFDHQSSIFFIEGFGKDYISARMLCSIESAAIVHRNAFIDVMMTSRTLRKSEGIRSLLKAYSNIRFLYLNARKLYMESPLWEWYLLETWKDSRYPDINFDDPLRFLLLYKYGGIYLDMDVIVLKNLTKEENFAGLEDDSLVNSAVMGFKKSHPFLNDCIAEMTNYFDGTRWGVNGPMLITKIFRRRCHVKLPNTTMEHCSDIKLFEQHVFYPIPWTDLNMLFEEDQEFTDALLNYPEILTLHFWNQLTKGYTILLDELSLYSVIARNMCPITAFVFNYQF